MFLNVALFFKKGIKLSILITAGRALKKICSCAPLLGLVPKADNIGRDEGISAVVLVRDEPWLEPSILSVQDIADEIIIVDCSKKDITPKVRELRSKGLNIKFARSEIDITKQLRKAIELSSKKWILKWDSDFVAYKSGERDIKKLKNIIQGLPPEKYYHIKFNVVNVVLDFFHTSKPFIRESYLFTYSDALLKPRPINRLLYKMFLKLKKKMPPRHPYLPFPFWYNKLVLDDVFIMHVNIKPRQRLFERKSQARWALVPDNIKQSKYMGSYDFYVKEFANQKWSADIETAKGLFIESLKKELKPFKTELYGDYPEILKQWVNETFGSEIKPTEEFSQKLSDFLEGSA